MFKLILTYALARGFWHGLHGRTKVIKNGRLGVFAYGDGWHDDTARIQRAIDKGSGGIRYIPTGTFIITEPLIIDNNVTLRGVPWNPMK